MTTTTTWNIANIDWRTSDGYITTIHWTVNAVDGQYTANSYGSVGLTGNLTTPYAQCDAAWCIAAAKTNLGEDQVANIESGLANQIEQQKEPETGSGGSWDMVWCDVADGSAPSSDFRWTTSDPEFIALRVNDRIKASDPAGAIPVGATCIEKREDGVTVWDHQTTLSGVNVPFKVAIDHSAVPPEAVPA